MVLVALIIIAPFFLTTVMNVLFWRKPRSGQTSALRVAVLIPARNEENFIGCCIEKVLEQGDSVERILVYDDHSTDRTAEIVREKALISSKVGLVEIADLPGGWTGKNFACHRLALASDQQWLLFLDADTEILPGAVNAMLAEAAASKLTFLSLWPGLRLESFGEKVLMPMLNFLVYTIYPAPLAEKYSMPSLGIAHGACILVRKDAYERGGGHAAVRSEIFEDTQLARRWRTAGERSLCLDGQDYVSVRMYGSVRSIWEGFRKNFYPGFCRESSFWALLFLHAAVFMAPFPLAVAELCMIRTPGVWSLMAGLVLLMRVMLTVRFRYQLWPVILHPLAEVFLCMLALSSRRGFRSGSGVRWKDRVYSREGKS
jgi:chlorobactene glucosyltransferase